MLPLLGKPNNCRKFVLVNIPYIIYVKPLTNRHNMIGKIIKFGCALIAIGIILSVATCSALLSNYNPPKPQSIMLKQNKTLHIRQLTVVKVLDDGNVLAQVDDYDGDIEFMGKVLIRDGAKNGYVDNQVIRLRSGRVTQIGVYKKRTTTIPIVRIRQ